MVSGESQCLAGFWGSGVDCSEGSESQVRAIRKRTFVGRVGSFQDECEKIFLFFRVSCSRVGMVKTRSGKVTGDDRPVCPWCGLRGCDQMVDSGDYSFQCPEYKAYPAFSRECHNDQWSGCGCPACFGIK